MDSFTCTNDFAQLWEVKAHRNFIVTNDPRWIVKSAYTLPPKQHILTTSRRSPTHRVNNTSTTLCCNFIYMRLYISLCSATIRNRIRNAEIARHIVPQGNELHIDRVERAMFVFISFVLVHDIHRFQLYKRAAYRQVYQSSSIWTNNIGHHRLLPFTAFSRIRKEQNSWRCPGPGCLIPSSDDVYQNRLMETSYLDFLL